MKSFDELGRPTYSPGGPGDCWVCGKTFTARRDGCATCKEINLSYYASKVEEDCACGSCDASHSVAEKLVEERDVLQDQLAAANAEIAALKAAQKPKRKRTVERVEVAHLVPAAMAREEMAAAVRAERIRAKQAVERLWDDNAVGTYEKILADYADVDLCPECGAEAHDDGCCPQMVKP